MNPVSDNYGVKLAEAAPVAEETRAIALPTVEALGLVPFHSCIPEIERWVFRDIPYLTSVHHVTDAEPMDRHYCEVHTHHDEDEVNLLLGTTADFRFRITVGDRSHVVGPIAALHIPAGTTHSANVISGSGYYVVLKAPIQHDA
jgi:hypothetical protein